MTASLKNPTLWPADVNTKPTAFLVASTGDLANWIGGCPYAASLICWSVTHSSPLLCSLPCKRWGCAFCGRRRIRDLALRTEAAQPNRFFTLTTNTRAFTSAREAFLHGGRKFADLTKLIRREVGPIDYLRVIEAHANGFPHWHVLARCPYIDQRDLSRWWAQLHHSPIVDIRNPKKIRSTYAYVVKYLGKQHYVPWTNRRIATSRHFFPPRPPNEHAGWKLNQKTRLKKLPEQVALRFAAGKVLTRLTDTAFLIEVTDAEADEFEFNGRLNGRYVEEFGV